jgi:hypothetical protein
MMILMILFSFSLLAFIILETKRLELNAALESSIDVDSEEARLNSLIDSIMEKKKQLILKWKVTPCEIVYLDDPPYHIVFPDDLRNRRFTLNHDNRMTSSQCIRITSKIFYCLSILLVVHRSCPRCSHRIANSKRNTNGPSININWVSKYTG